jgi:hypothetical protein
MFNPSGHRVDPDEETRVGEVARLVAVENRPRHVPADTEVQHQQHTAGDQRH